MNYSNAISGRISEPAIKGQESSAFICKNTADASFLRRTDTKKQSSAKKKGSAKNLILLHYKIKIKRLIGSFNPISRFLYVI